MTADSTERNFDAFKEIDCTGGVSCECGGRCP